MVFNLPKRRSFALVIAPVLFLSGMAYGDDRPLRTYFVGNSVTDTIRYGSLAKLAMSRGHKLTWGRDMIPGASLSWLWEHSKDGFQEEPFGLYPRALSGYPWDVLSLQPFDRHLVGKDGDLAMAGNFIDLALRRSPDIQVYVYSRWPRKDKAKDGSLVLDYKTKWLISEHRPQVGAPECCDRSDLVPGPGVCRGTESCRPDAGNHGGDQRLDLDHHLRPVLIGDNSPDLLDARLHGESE